MTDSKPSKGRADRAGQRAKARVLLVCDRESRRNEVAGKLGRLKADVAAGPWHEYVERLGAGDDAVVLAEPLPVAAAAAVAAVRGHRHGRRLPVYVVTGDSTPARRVRNMYASGATAVFAWPSEAPLLSDLLAETLGMAKVRGRAKKPDVALGRTVRAHLRLGPRPGSGIRVTARGGAVTVSGEARTLARKREILEAIAAVPGVTRIHSAALRVAGHGVSDRALEKDVLNVVRRMSDVDPEALTVSVKSGRVELRGSVPSRAELQRLMELIENVKGVRELRYAVASGRPAADHRVRDRLLDALASLFPGERVDLAVFQGVAVLSGSVGSLSAKRRIERQVARDDAIQRVVNKLRVSGG